MNSVLILPLVALATTGLAHIHKTRLRRVANRGLYRLPHFVWCRSRTHDQPWCDGYVGQQACQAVLALDTNINQESCMPSFNSTPGANGITRSSPERSS